MLDEPTNHLDLESREALEAALEAFPGTVLLVSHDRALLDAVAERTLAIEELRAARVRRRLGGDAAPPRGAGHAGGGRCGSAAQPKAERKPKPAKPRARRPSELERIEAEIAAREAEVRELEAKLAEDWSNVETLAAHKRSRDALAGAARALGSALRNSGVRPRGLTPRLSRSTG